ncbi:MAG: penicillin-binding protein 2, partial [Bacteroidetes bacterium]|nr:penicillin-binding protein 2 [Bacteroidota bacterium]
MGLHDELHVYRKRRALYALIIVVFLVLMGRLYQLQLIYRDEYGKKSEENSIRIIPREPVRGMMFDRHGVLVVDNRPAFTVTIMPFEFDRRAIPSLARLLALDPADLSDRLARGEAYSRFAPVKIQRDFDFRTLSALEEMRDALPGVSYQIESKRYYPTAARASHLFGYTKEISEGQLAQSGEGYEQGDVVGSTGLEAQYERSLRGAKGAEFSTVNVHGQVVGSFDNGRQDLPAVDGRDLLLTLDADLQAFAESLMVGRAGAVVAIDPADGGILAMVSKPDYDLGIFSGVTTPDLWRSLNADPTHPLFNRATLTRYPPGSTFKMILALAALENNVVTPGWRVSCGGAFRLGNKVFKDLHVHGSTDMIESIQRSCNVYYYQVMLKVGLDAWSEMGSRFGFGKLTGMDILEESPGLLPSTAFMNRRYGDRGWTRGFLPSLGIGQGELGVTPLQMAVYAMILANGGAYHQPHTVRAVVDRQHNSIDTVLFQTRMLKISARSWEIVREGMRRVVQEPGGTGSLARIQGMESGGKTGTAQNPHGADHAWYVGFAPFDNPRIAMAVLVENAGFGGSFAAPVAGKCMERYLRRILPPDGTLPDGAPSPAPTARP